MSADLIIREYNFASGLETPSQPTAGTPAGGSDLVTKNYADKSYWRSVATVADLKAISTSDRSQYQLFFVNALGAVFRYDSASSATGNDVTIVTPTDSTGRYLLLTQSPFAGDIQLDSSSTGSNQTLSTPTKLIRACSNASLVSVAGIAAAVVYQLFIWVNETGTAVTIKDQSASASVGNRIFTGTNADLVVVNGASLWLLYDVGAGIWRVVGGSGSGGGALSVKTAQTISAAGTITLDLTAMRQLIPVSGNSAPVDVANALFGSGPFTDGMEVELIGTDDTNTITIYFFDSANGCVGSIGTSFTLAKYERARMVYMSSLTRWVGGKIS